VKRSGAIEHLYLGAPPPAPGMPERWSGALSRELALREADGWRLAPVLRTVHVGGGEPSAMGPALPERALRGLGLESRSPGELSVEARAGEISPGLLDAWLEAGVSRVALRVAAPDALARAAELLRGSGLPVWSVDVAFGASFPSGGSPRDAVRRLGRILALEPPQVSLEEAPPDRDPDRTADEYLALADALEEAGWEQWELTSFVRNSSPPAHPLAVRRGAPYLGLGPAAHSFDGVRRLWNLEAPDAYFSRIGRGADPAAGGETPDAGQRFLERVWSGLRLAEGLPSTELPAAAAGIRSRWVEQGWAHPDPHRLRLTRRGWLLLDGLAVELASTGPVDAGSGSR
jgi:oxygen-independent coproporphyrinogen III oxidase